jgi:hypothetical protein
MPRMIPIEVWSEARSPSAERFGGEILFWHTAATIARGAKNVREDDD